MDTINIGAYGFLESIAGLAIEVKMICVKFAVMFAVLTAIYGVVKFYFGFEEGGKINFTKYVWTPLITIFLLVNYAYIIDITDSIGSLLIRSIPGSDNKEIYTELLNSSEKRRAIERISNYNAEQAVMNDDEAGFFKKVGVFLESGLRETLSQLFSPIRMLGKLFQTGWIILCRLIIENVRGVILGFLVICGPLAILFSITPLHREMLKKWYKMYVAVMLWAVTINIMDALVISYAQASVGVDLTQAIYVESDLEDENVAASIMAADEIASDFGTQAGFINFVFGLMYLCVPLLTAFFIGDRMAGGLLSFVMMKSIDYGMKAVSAVASGGKVVGGSSIGGGAEGDTSGTE